MSHRNGNRVMRERERLDFAKIKTTVQIPNLIDVQKKSYRRFLQMDLLPSEREDTGLQSVFSSVFPIQDFRGLSQLDFVRADFGEDDGEFRLLLWRSGCRARACRSARHHYWRCSSR